MNILKWFISLFSQKQPQTAPVQVQQEPIKPITEVFKISMEELLNKKYKLENQSIEIQNNLKELQRRVCSVRDQWGNAWTVTSGLRTMADHLRIYKEKAKKDGVEFDEAKVPKKSKHLYGQAVDIYDPELKITAWLKANPSILDMADLWAEEGNSNWMHFQSVPFGSYKAGGTRWFKP